MVVFTVASSSLFNFALSLAKIKAAAKQLTAKGTKMINTTNIIDSTIINPKLFKFPPGM